MKARERMLIYRKRLSDGRFAEVVPLLFSRARICLLSDVDTYANEW